MKNKRNGFKVKILLLMYLLTGLTLSSQAQWENVGSAEFSAASSYQSLAFHPDTKEPYVAFSNEDNSEKSTVMKFNGSTWEAVGTNGFSGGGAFFQSLAFHPTTKEPYVAFQDNDNNDKSTVMKYNGTAWENVGNAGFGSSVAQSYQSLAFHPTTHEPYVAVSDEFESDKTTVRRYDGSDWVKVGAAGFSEGVSTFQSLAFNPSTNEPYVAFSDEENGNKTTVMRFNGTAWENVGNAGFSTGIARFQSLAFHPTTHEPYVAFENPDNDNKTTVMKFNGTAWENVGNAGFSAPGSRFQSLVFHPTSHEPFVAFRNGDNDSKATVMRFNGTDWSAVGTAGFSASSSAHQSLAFHPDTHEPYVAFSDQTNSGGTTVMKFSMPEINLKEGTNDIASGGEQNLGTVTVNSSSADFTFSIENTGTVNLTFTGTAGSLVVLGGTNADQFSVVQTGISSPIAVNTDQSFTVKFSPTSVGEKTATLTITSNDLDESTYTINLKGTGTEALVPEINIKEGANDITSGDNYNFSTVGVNSSSSDITFTIENTGTGELALSDVAGNFVVLSGANSDQFSVLQTGVTSPIAAGGSQTFTAKFSPTSAGEKTAVLTISSNDADEATYTINLKGTGQENTSGGVVTSLENLEEETILTYPNPTEGKVTIDKLPTGTTTLVLSNSLGNEILTKEVQESLELDLSQLPTGIYHLTLNTSQGIFTKKIIKQ